MWYGVSVLVGTMNWCNVMVTRLYCTSRSGAWCPNVGRSGVDVWPFIPWTIVLAIQFWSGRRCCCSKMMVISIPGRVANGWILQVGETQIAKGKGPVYGNNPRSFQAKGYGMASALLYLHVTEGPQTHSSVTVRDCLSGLRKPLSGLIPCPTSPYGQNGI
jgi:hypothetical protein